MFVITLLFPVYLVYGLLAFKAEQSPPKKSYESCICYHCIYNPLHAQGNVINVSSLHVDV